MGKTLTQSRVLFAGIVAMSMLFMVFSPGLAQAMSTWSTAAEVSPNNVSVAVSGSDTRQQLSTSDNGAHTVVVWSDVTGVHAANSQDQGETWSSPATIPGSATIAGIPRLTGSANGTAYAAVWPHQDSSGDRTVYASNSTDGGQSWSTPTTVVPAQQTVINMRSAASSDGSTVTATWTHRVNNRNRVQVATSQDGGTTWGNPTSFNEPVFASNAVSAANIVVSDDGTQQAIVWLNRNADHRVRVAYSQDSGATWNTSTSLVTTPDTIFQPVITGSSDGNALAIAWTQQSVANGDRQAYSATSSDAGVTWSSPVAISAAGLTAAAVELVLSDDGTNAQAIWINSGFPTSDIATSQSTDGGQTWATPVTIEANANSVNNLRIAGSDDGSKLTAVWGTLGRYSTSDDSGATWSTADYIMPNGGSGASRLPQVVSTASGSTFIASWRQYVSSGLFRLTTANLQSPDSVPPTVVGVPDRAPNASNWYNGAVTIDWQATDPTPSSGTPTDPADTIANLEGINTYISDDSCDPAGNCATGSIDLAIDTVAPTVAFSGNQGTYGASDTVNITCTASDATSGVTTSSTCPSANGPAYNYIGGGELTATVADNADNTTNETTTFDVTVNASDLHSLINEFVDGPSFYRFFLHIRAQLLANSPNANVCERRLNRFVNLVEYGVPSQVSAADAATLNAVAAELCNN